MFSDSESSSGEYDTPSDYNLSDSSLGEQSNTDPSNESIDDRNKMATSLKRKVPPIASPEAGNKIPAVSAEAVAAAPSKRVTPPKSETQNIYDARNSQMEDCLEAAGKEHYLLWTHGGVSELLPEKMEELGIEIDEDEDEWGGFTHEEWQEKVTNRLTLEEVDRCFTTMLVPQKMQTLVSEFGPQIEHADPQPLGSWYLNSHSGNCMIEVIQKQLAKAHRVLNKAVKFVKDQQTPAVVLNVAREAFLIVYAAIFACHQVEHWRLDCEDVEGAHKIVKKVSKMLQDLLWFHDEELGFIDPFTRTSMIARLNHMVKDWNSGKYCVLEGVTLGFASAKNNQGKGRTLSSGLANDGPAAKKTKTTASLITPEEKEKLKERWEQVFNQIKTKEEYTNLYNKLGTMMSAETQAKSSEDARKPPPIQAKRNDVMSVLMHLDALGESLPQRCKSYAQLLVQQEGNPKKNCQFVCSGSFSLKKMSQLVAFLTGHSEHYEYHINRGTSLQGSYLELSVDGGKNVLWLGDKLIQKKAHSEGAGYAVDKPIKIVQVFQGLIKSRTSGMVWDDSSNGSPTNKKDVSLTWISDKGDRFSVIVQGIIAIESCSSSTNKTIPLPRVVDDDYNNSRKKTGFQKSIRQTNKILRGDRIPGRATYYLCTKAQAKQAMEAAAVRPVCNADGTKLYDEYAFSKGVSSATNKKYAYLAAQMLTEP